MIATSEPTALSKRYRWQFMGLGLLAVVCTLGFFYLLPTTITAWQAQ